MSILLIIGLIALYEFLGIVMAVGFYDGDESILALCLMVWPIVVLIALAMWTGKKLKHKIEDK